MRRIRVRCPVCRAKDVENAFAPEHSDPKYRWCWQCGEKGLVIKATQTEGERKD